jgi:hypothetical protein
MLSSICTVCSVQALGAHLQCLEGSRLAVLAHLPLNVGTQSVDTVVSQWRLQCPCAYICDTLCNQSICIGPRGGIVDR